MKINLYRFAVIGGDMRQVYLAEILAKRGYKVSVYGLERKVDISGIKEVQSLKDALKEADVIAAPVPFLKSDKIFGNREFSELTTENILQYAKTGSLFFAGGISEVFKKKAEEKQIQCVDYMKDESIAMQNTVATAEGILAEAIKRSPRNLYKSDCLVLGYGKCGSTLVSYLKKFFCNVTVYEKEPSVAACAVVAADKAADVLELPRCLMEAQYIFNTIPSLILPKAMLEYVRRDAIILDLATAPGGVDYQAAEKMGIQAVLLPGLPGKYAPLSSAEILADGILKKLV